jgi:SNF2 family DNA or RNA helicase
MLSNNTIQQTWTHSWDAKGTMNLLNILFHNSLTDESPKAEQSADIRIPLRPHQRAVVAAMKKLEEDSFRGREFNTYTTYSNYGFIGDEVGTGKSLSILSFIAQMKIENAPIENYRLVSQNCAHLFTLEKRTVKSTDATLIVVPHTLFRQWQTYIKQQTTLKCFDVKSRANLNIDTFKNNVAEADIILVSNTLYNSLMEMAKENDVTWKRIFIDEADSIHITSTSVKLNAGFVWFISASWANFLLHGSVLRNHLYQYLTGPNEIPNLDPELKIWLANELGPNVTNAHYVWLRMKSPNFFRDFMSTSLFRSLQVIRCRQNFIDTSMTMPPLLYEQILCEEPMQYRVVNGLINHEIQAMLDGGDIQGALEELGVKAENPTSLLDAFLNQQNKELDRLKRELEFKEKNEYTSAKAKEEALARLQSKIESVERQIQTFKARMESLKTELCPICYEEPAMTTTTTMTPCCHRIFCAQCILACLARKPVCPMCRTSMSAKSIIHLDEKNTTTKTSSKKSKKEKQILLRKPEALLHFLISNPTAKVLVFSRYENPFAGLAMRCLEAGIQVQVLKGNKDCIASSVREFEAGTKRVLFLHTHSVGAGMNLVGASHVVLYHQMTPEEERQVVGRAYRLGRQEPLRVIRLVHSNEPSATV